MVNWREYGGWITNWNSRLSLSSFWKLRKIEPSLCLVSIIRFKFAFVNATKLVVTYISIIVFIYATKNIYIKSSNWVAVHVPDFRNDDSNIIKLWSLPDANRFEYILLTTFAWSEKLFLKQYQWIIEASSTLPHRKKGKEGANAFISPSVNLSLVFTYVSITDIC